MLNDALPVDAHRTQRIGDADHGHGQAARMEARVVQLARLETGGQLAGGLHRQRAVAVDLEFAAVVQGDAHFIAVKLFYRPVGRQWLGQLLALGDEAQVGAIGGGDADAFLPVGGVRVQMLLLDAAHQGACENVLGVAVFDVGQAQRLTVLIAVLAVDHAYQLHHLRQPGQGFLACLRLQRLLHGTTETVVEGAAPGCVVTPKTHDHR